MPNPFIPEYIKKYFSNNPSPLDSRIVDDREVLSKKLEILFMNTVNSVVGYNLNPFVDITKEGFEGASFKAGKNIIKDSPRRTLLIGQVVTKPLIFNNEGINKAYLVKIPSEKNIMVDLEKFELESSITSNNIEKYISNLFFPITQLVNDQQIPEIGDFVIVERVFNTLTTSEIYEAASTANIFHGIHSKKKTIAESTVNDKTKKGLLDTINTKYKLELETIEQSVFASVSPITDNIAQQFSGQLGLPTNFIVTSLMGLRVDPVSEPGKDPIQFHKGIDFGCPENIPIKAVADGVIVKSEFDEKGGNLIKIQHKKLGNIFSLYLHLNELKKKVGDQVSKDEIIGLSGKTGFRTTGPHLHFELKDAAGNNINPLFMFKGSIQVSDAQKSRYGLQSNTLTLPLPVNKLIKPQKPQAIADNKAPSIKSKDKKEKTNKKGTTASDPVTSPKMLLVDFKTDYNFYTPSSYKNGTRTIKIREDIVDSLTTVKEILNYFGIPFSTQYQDINIANKNLSYLGRAGLEFHLNKHATLTPENNIQICDYIISPNLSKNIYNNGYELNLWGRVRSSPSFEEVNGYKYEKRDLLAYEIINKKLVTTEINGNFFNITKLLNDYGFYHVSPKYDFFKLADYEKSNWWVINSYSRIELNDSYEKVLEKIYYRDQNPAWINSEKIVWNGKIFINGIS